VHLIAHHGVNPSTARLEEWQLHSMGGLLFRPKALQPPAGHPPVLLPSQREFAARSPLSYIPIFCSICADGDQCSCHELHLVSVFKIFVLQLLGLKTFSIKQAI